MSDTPKPSFFSGTSNLVLPIRQADFPPEWKGASRLTYYASLFSSVEINATFYKLPRPATVKKWSESVPPHFRFTFKVPKSLTHSKGLQTDIAIVAQFAEVVAAAALNKGCLLVQLPPSLTREYQEELEGLLQALLDDVPGWPIAVEFRNTSWYDRTLYRVLQGYGAVPVLHDMAKAPMPLIAQTQPFVYRRFHGPEPGYRGSYDDAFLAAEATRIAAWLAEGREVYAYFNNTLGDALANLQALNGRLAGLGVH